METGFFVDNRDALYAQLRDDSILLLFAGSAPRQTADAYYPFYASRNFVYLTGLEEASEGFVLMARKHAGRTEETLFLLPPDEHAEIWNGRRVKPGEAEAISGIRDIRFLDGFAAAFHREAASGRYAHVYLDLFKNRADEPDDEAYRFAALCAKEHPYLAVRNALPLLRGLRTIKKPCEIEAMRRAIDITGQGIRAMMRASRPGMREYEYKAAFDEALTRQGVSFHAFAPIISVGDNNFCIHYNRTAGTAMDGDMVLNDVGAKWDGMCCDVSRGWPVNGTFSEKQRLLYECAYRTSEHMFGIIKPGMPMADVDRLAREHSFAQLREIGLCERYEDVGTYIWHGGAHHVGWDTHDVTDMTRDVAAGMVFCVDIGIYCRAWGIGFRLEDNCLVTEDGCENLSAGIPRTIEAIEAAMAK